jgi:hypothetical protein
MSNIIPSVLTILKEFYTGETEDEKNQREFYNKCAKLKGLPEIQGPNPDLLSGLVYKKNPLLDLVKE